MAKFDYKPANAVMEAYGKKYPIPTKTAVLVDGIAEINKKLLECKNTFEVVRVTKEGIGLFIGEAETNRIFSAPDGEIDTDELSAFWLALNAESNRATKEIIEKYSPRPVGEIKKPLITVNKK